MEAKPYKIPHPFRKLSKELIDILVLDIAEGSTQSLAAKSNRITESIFYIWLAQGEIDIEHGQDTLCAYLVESLAKVKKNEVKMCRNAIVSSDKGHKGAEWTLEHAHARDFSGNAVVQEFKQEMDEFRLKLAQGSINGDPQSSETE